VATRIISALVAISVLLPVAYVGGWAFCVLALFVVGVCLHEFFTMTQAGDWPTRIAGVGAGVLIALLILGGGATGEAGLGVAAGVVILPALWFLLRTGQMETAASRAGLATLGLLWVGVLGGLTSSLVYLEDGFAWLLLAATLGFGSDVGGYFAGRFFGRHKLYEKVSPMKTWEGSVGGIVLATALAFAFWQVVGPEQVEAKDLFIIAPAGAAFGQLGDLAESLLKRSLGVKDSGAIMPGHGGLLDRIDALLFVGPPLFLYARLVLGVPVAWLG
jgi:phosphatidate cytidylyltransferase